MKMRYARVSAASINKKGHLKVAFVLLVEAAGIEPASASPPLRGLHAYSVINLITGYPTGRENL